MISGISKRERDALKALMAGPVRRSAMPDSIKEACDGQWQEAGYIVKQEVSFGKFLYCVRDSRMSAFMAVVDEMFPGFDEDDEKGSTDYYQAAQFKSSAKAGRHRDTPVMLRDFSGVFGGRNHLDDLQSFRVSTLERQKLRTGLLVLTVQDMDTFLNVEPNKDGLPAFDVAIYMSSDPSERLMQWISGMQYSSFTHYAQFDYQGMNIYQRFRNWCPPGACRLYKPKGLDEALARFIPAEKKAKKPTEKKAPVVKTARIKKSDIPEIDDILAMIDANGGVGLSLEPMEEGLDIGMELEFV